jgi:hypothetical protein
MSDVLWRRVTEYWAQSPAERPATELVVHHMTCLVPKPESEIFHFMPSGSRDKLPSAPPSGVDNFVKKLTSCFKFPFIRPIFFLFLLPYSILVSHPSYFYAPLYLVLLIFLTEGMDNGSAPTRWPEDVQNY